MHKLGGLRPAVIRAERVELERRVQVFQVISRKGEAGEAS